MMGTTSYRSPRTRYYRRYALQYCKTHAFVLSLGVVYLVGIWLGARTTGLLDETLMDNLTTILSGFVVERSGQSIQQTMFSALASSVGVLVFLFISGFCAIAGPVIVLAPLFKGLGFGLAAAGMTSIYGSAAFGYVGLLLLPGAVCSALVTLFASREAFRLSVQFFSLIRGEKREEGISATVYCVRFAVFLLLLVLTAALEGVLFATFAASLTPIG